METGRAYDAPPANQLSKAERPIDLMERLAALAEAAGTASDLIELFRSLRTFAEATVPYCGLFVSLYDRERQQRVCVYAGGAEEDEDTADLPPLPMNDSPNSRAIKTGEIIRVDDFQAAIKKARVPVINLGLDKDPNLPQSCVAVPLIVLGEVIGAFEVQSTQLAAYNDEHVTILRMAASLAAIATRNVQLLQAERQSRLKAEQSTRAVQESEEHFRSLIENSSDMIIVLGSDAVITYASPSVSRTMGYEPEEIVGQSGFNFVHPDDVEATTESFARTLLGVNEQVSIEFRIRRADGEWRVVEAWSKRLARNGESVVVVNYRDITERKKADERIHTLAYRDSLTGLPNRSMFKDRLEMALAQLRRSGRRLAVMFLDLDGFKQINDTRGHSVGDQLLQSVGLTLSKLTRRGETVARVGGDEFMVLLPDLDDPRQVVTLAERILQGLKGKSHAAGGHDFHVTASIGIAISPDDGEDAENLLRHADTAMYRAKENGRARYELYSRDMSAAVLERVQLEADLRRAVVEGEFVLYYQPILQGDGRLAGVEALIRWNEPAQGLVMPNVFIPALEESGLIVPVGDWVIQQALGQQRAWERRGLERIPVAVNISAVQFQRRDLVQYLRGLQREEQVPLDGLRIEITESLIMQDVDHAVSVLGELREMGIQVSMDDFGTGYSSLGYLKRLPLDSVKIDRSFLVDVPGSERGVALVTSMINLAHALGLSVVAEGVETEEQLAFLRAHGCDQYQGYLFSRAVPAGDIPRIALDPARPEAPAPQY